MIANQRRRILILAAGVSLLAVIYPLSRFLESKPPPCHIIMSECRAQGLHNFGAPNRKVYRDCIKRALKDGVLGEVTFASEDLDECREYRNRRDKKSPTDAPAE